MEIIISCICSIAISTIISFMMSNVVGIHYMQKLCDHQEKITEEYVKTNLDYCEKAFEKKNNER